ncbi:hypothetical protein RQP46_010761 [Phenoliferia psychrophenolica]
MGNSQSIPNDDVLLQILAWSSERGSEYESAKEQQRNRFAFSLIGKKAIHRVISANSGQFLFHVIGEHQADDLLKKLQLERSPAGAAGRQKRPEGTREDVTKIRRLSLTVTGKRWNSYKRLLLATPDLVALDFNVFDFTTHHADAHKEPGTSKQLTAALGGLQQLEDLKVRFCSCSCLGIIEILAKLPGLQAFDLTTNYYRVRPEYSALLEKSSLPRLRRLRIHLEDQFSVDLFGALVTCSDRLRSLDLDWSKSNLVPIHVIRNISPNLVHFTWNEEPPTSVNSEGDWRRDRLALLSAMTSLKSIRIAAWRLETERYDNDNNRFPKLDPDLLQTLATLPSLHTVTLTLPGRDGEHNPDQLIDYIFSHKSLRALPTKISDRWTDGQRARVAAAADEAGVTLNRPKYY